MYAKSPLSLSLLKEIRTPVFVFVAATFIVSGFFVAPSMALAAHTATVSVAPTLVKGNQSSTYTFNITNNGADAIYRAIVTIPSGFTSVASASCPTGMTASEVSSVQVICLGDPFDAGTLIANGATAQVSFSATSPTPGSDTLYTWSVATRDTTGTSVVNTSAQTNVDVTAPTIFAAVEQDTNGDGKIDKVSVTFSEFIKDSTITASQFALAGTPFDGYTTGTADDDEVDFTVSAGVAGTEQKEFTYAAGSLTDLADNSMTSKDAAAVSEQDSASPVMVSAQTKTTTRIDTTWSENIDGTTVNDLGTEFTVTGFAVSVADDNSDNIVELTVATMPTGATPGVTFTNSVTFRDLNGNEAVTPTTVTAADGITPTFTAIRTAINTIVLTFSENITSSDVDTDSFTVVGASAVSAGAVVENTSITLTTTGLTATDGTPLVNYVAATGDVADTATNEVADGGAVAAADQVAPIVAITSSASPGPTKNSPIPMTVTFSETVTGFDIDDITVTNGIKASFEAVSETVYTFNVTAPGEGAVTVDVAGGVAKDVANNDNAAATQFSITYDSIAPDVISIVLADPALKAGETSLITITFSEAVTGFTNDDITTIENGVLTAVSSADSGITWTATFTPTDAITDDANVITITKTGVTDLAGNNGVSTTSSANYVIDTVQPTVEITMGAATFKVGEATTVTFTFSEAPTNFTADDVTVGGGTIGTIDATNPLVQTATFTPTADTEDTVNVITVGTAWTDAAGNAPLAGDDSPNYTIDTKMPSVVLASVTANPTNGLIAVTAEFSETVTDFDVTDITVTNGTVGDFVPVDGNSYTFNVNPTDGASVAVTVDVLADKAADAAGNNNTASNQLAYTSDTIAPTVTSITRNLATITEADLGTDKFTITVNYSEAMDQTSTPQIPLDPALEISGTLVGNNPLSGWTDADTYVRHYNVIDIDETAVGVDISVTTAKDLAGNTQTAGDSTDAFDVDTAAPSAPSTPDLAAASDSNITTDDITSNTTPTFTGTAEADSTVTVYDGATPVGTGTATGGNYSIVVSTLSSGVHSITAKTTDAVGNESPFSSALSVTVDTANPTVSFSLPAADNVVKGTTIKLTSTASDDLSEVTCQYKIGSGGSYVTLESCVNTNVDLTDANFADGRNTFYVKATDGAGNSSEQNVSFVIDTNNTLTVNGAGGADFTTIQAAVTAATANDTISIATGTYAEAVTIAKTLTLTGTGSPTATSFTLNSGAILTGSTGITAITVNVNSGAKIQDGILLTSSGGTVNVGAGTYAEAVTIGTPLTLHGADRTTTILNAAGIDNAVTINANNVTVEGMQIINANRVGISLGSVSDVTIQDNIIKNNNQVSDVIQGQIRAYRVIISNLTITNNVIQSDVTLNNEQTGIRLNEVSGTNYDILNNQFIGAGDPLVAGDRTGMRRGILLKNPTSSGPSGTMVDVTIDGNEFTDVGEGIMLDGALRGDGVETVTISSNTFVRHSSGGVILYGNVKDVTITGNTFGPYAGAATDRPDMRSTISHKKYAINGLTVTGNTFDQGLVQVYLGGASGTLSGTIAINDNGFTNAGQNISGAMGGTAYAVQNISATTVDATKNWFGTTDSATIATKISTFVDYRPWCTNEACSPIDTTLPTVAISSLLTSDTTPTITGTVVEINAVTVTITVNSHDYVAVVTGGTWSANVTDALTAGTYNVVATAEDSAGNIGTDVTNNELTVDTVAPTLSPVSIASNNSNTALAKVGDIISLTFTSNEEIQTPNVTIDGHTGVSLENNSGNNWTATYTMTEADAGGAVVFSITPTDLAGNVGAAITTVVGNTSSVTFDKTAPVVAITSIAGDNYINNSEKGAIVVVGTAEANALVSVSLTNGETVSGTQQLTDGGTAYSITINGSTLSNGTVTPSVTATDAAGNVSAAVTTPTATKDITAPSVSSHTPSLNALSISPATAIVVTFDEAVVVESGDVSFDPVISGGFSITNSGTNVVTITPINSLANNTTYTITLAGVTDLAGNALPTYSNIQFTTATTYSVALNVDTGGWNLISLPVIPIDTAIAEVLGSASDNIDAVWTYDPTDSNAVDGWLSYSPGDPEGTNNLDTMTTGFGYWVSVTGDTNLSGSGTLLIAGPTPPPSRSLETGWNLIGYYQLPNEDQSTPTDAFASIGASGVGYNGLWGFNNTTGNFKSVTTILPGDGFWISLPSAKTYTPSNL